MNHYILLLTKKSKVFNKSAVKHFYKSQHYSARFIGFDNCFIFSEDNLNINGSVIVSEVEKQNFLHALVTASDQQRMGIGSKLVEHCKSNFDHLICFADITLKSFYLPLGFTIKSEDMLSASLLTRWQSYQKKNPNLVIFSFKRIDE